jgi:multiple sugar transport system permease protein
MTSITQTIPADRARALRRRRRRTSSAGYAFVLPAAIMFSLFILVPIGYTVVLSTKAMRVSGLGIIGRRHEVSVGLGNYVDAIHDPELLHSLLRMVIFGLIVVPLMLGFATLFALMLDSPRTRFGSFSRVAIFLPYAVPVVVASLLWGFMYLPDVSPFRYAAAQLGLPQPQFFGAHSIFLSVSNIAIWGGTGFNMIVLYTNLRAIPTEMFDAARIDGCNEVQVARYVKLPMLRPALVLTTIFSLIATLQVFNEPFSLTPLTNVLSSTWVPLMKVYRDAFINDDIYSPAATSVLLALGTLILSTIVLRFLNTKTIGDQS